MPQSNPAASRENIKTAKQVLKSQFPKVNSEYTNEIHLLLERLNLEKFAEENNLNKHAVSAALVEMLNKRSQEPKIV